MPQKRRFFKRSKAKDVEEKEKKIVKKLQKGEVEFKKIERTAKKEVVHKKRPHFPSFSRSIPESSILSTGSPTSLKLRGTSRLSLKWEIVGILIIVGIILNYFVIRTFMGAFSNWSSLLVKRQKITEQMTLWENISQQYPNYRDAYVKGAIFAYELGDREKEQYFLGKLQLLDPNFPLTRTFEQLDLLQQER